MQKYALQMAKVNLTYAKFVGGGICGRNERQQVRYVEFIPFAVL